jgi:hypothetical protein
MLMLFQCTFHYNSVFNSVLYHVQALRFICTYIYNLYTNLFTDLWENVFLCDGLISHPKESYRVSK